MVAKTAVATLHPTRNDLPVDVRTKSVHLLQQCLADAIDLASQVKVAHWNVKGPSFIALHELFDRVHDEIEEHVDAIAERLTALGGTARGTARQAAATTGLPEYPASAVSGHDHVDAVAKALAAFGKAIRGAIEQSEENGDAGTADLFTGMSRAIDKQLWFVESHNIGKS